MNQCLDFLIYPSFQGINRLFVLSFKNKAERASCKRPYLRTVEMRKYNVIIDGQTFFEQPLEMIQ